MASILLFKDDSIERDYLREELKLRGHQVQEAEDLEGCIRRLSELRPEILIADQRLLDSRHPDLLKMIERDPLPP
ncbi:MAG TPA: response regulator [Deltaproteobacteria bacterium]|nr:response regulator [Deltaproteobacteria bacterium]